MSNNIKGITVEIGGDTTKLVDAVKGTNKVIGDTQAELREVNRQLKFDPNNTVLLEQKQKLLGTAIGETKEKLDTLKEAQKQAKAQFESGDLGEDKYRALQREVIKTESQLKGLENQAKETNTAVSKISQATSKISSVAGGVAKAMTPVTVGIGAAGAGAVKAMDDVDEGLDTVMVKTGATGEAAKKLEEIYREVAAEVPGEFGDIGAAVGEINTRLNLTDQALKTASVDFLKFAKINETDVNSSVQLVTRAMGDANIPAEEYKSILDALTVAAQKSGISIETLTTNLAKYGAPMRALGLDTQQSIAMFAAWEKAGVNTEIAFSGMKKAISNWSAAGKDSRKEFEKTLDAIKAAPDIASATSMAIETFGAKAGPDLADAIRGGRFELTEYTEALKNSGGAVDDTYGMVVDEVDDAQLAVQNLKLGLHDLGETIAKTLAPIFLKIANIIKGVLDGFNSLDSGTQSLILTIIAVIAAIGPVAGIISGIATAVNVLTVALTFLIAHPVVAIIAAVVAAIAALVAGFIYLWNNCEGFRQFWIDLWDGIQNVIKIVVDALVQFFTVTVPNAWNGLVSFFQGIPIWWNNLWTGVGQFFINCWNGIVSFFTVKIPAWINSVIKKISELPQKIGYQIGLILGNIVQFGLNIWNWITVELPNIISGIVQWFAVLPGQIWTWLSQTANDIARWCTDMYNSAVSGIRSVVVGIVQWFAALPGQIWTWLSQTVSDIAQWCADIYIKANEGINNTVQGIIAWFSELPGKLVETGKNIVTGLWQGIQDGWDWLKDKIGGFCGGIVDGFKNALGIHSPSRIFADMVGPYIPQGMWAGIESWMPNLKRNVAESMSGVIEAASEAIDATIPVSLTNDTVPAAAFSVSQNSQNEKSEKCANGSQMVVNIEKVEIKKPEDVPRIARELEYYRRSMERAKGGA